MAQLYSPQNFNSHFRAGADDFGSGELGADPDAAKPTHDEPTLTVSHRGSG